MKKHTFKVGDKVRVREWEDMVREYGLNSYGHINTPGLVFSKCADKDLCGKEVVINKFVCDNSVAVEGHIFWLPTAALEPIEEEIKEGDWVQVKSWDKHEHRKCFCNKDEKKYQLDHVYQVESIHWIGELAEIDSGYISTHCLRKVDPPEEEEALGDVFTREVPRTFASGIDENGNYFIEEIGNAHPPQPIKSFIKHGILDENEQLTIQGREVFIEWLLSKHQDEFYKEVVQKMEDKKK